MRYIRVRIRDGNDTLFWWDPWPIDGRLCLVGDRNILSEWGYDPNISVVDTLVGVGL